MLASPQQIQRLWFELFYMMIEYMFFNGINAQSDVGSPIDIVDIEAKGELIFVGQLIINIYCFNALAVPLL